MPEPLTAPPLYVFYSADDHARIRLGIELAVTLLRAPLTTERQRALAVDELDSVIRRMGG